MIRGATLIPSSALVLATVTGCDNIPVDARGKRLTEAERIAWGSCQNWAYQNRLNGPDVDGGYVLNSATTIAIEWSDFYGPRGVLTKCVFDTAGTNFQGVTVNGQPAWWPGKEEEERQAAARNKAQAQEPPPAK